jgi:hypothetical protein
MKKNSILITLLLITCASATFCMEPEQPNRRWVSYAADVIIYGTDALRDFLSFISLEPIYPPESKFASLLPEMQQTIIAFLSERTNASTLTRAARAINSLAQVNQQLNTLINDPIFSLQIIKHLAAQFDCSDETAAAALQTKEAKHRLAIQKQFEELFTAVHVFDEKLFNQLYKKYHKYVDLNFTYRYFDDPKLDKKDTLLIDAAQCDSYYKEHKINSLLKTNRIDINYQNKAGATALMQCAYFCNKPKELASLIAYPNININVQNKAKNTALHYACFREKYNQSKYIKILLDADADPEIANMDNQTPLTIIIKFGNDEEIDLLKKAIEKKHEKK